MGASSPLFCARSESVSVISLTVICSLCLSHFPVTRISFPGESLLFTNVWLNQTAVTTTLSMTSLTEIRDFRLP